MNILAEKRKYRRLDIKIPLECQLLSMPRSYSVGTSTCNICTGGVYFETAAENIKVGDQLSLELAVSSDVTRFPQHSKLTATANVVRTELIENSRNNETPPFTRYGVAAAFSDDLTLTM